MKPSVLLLVVALQCGPGVCVLGQDAAAHDNPFLDATDMDAGWPFIRGPKFDGHSPETRLADAWPDSGPPVLWTKELGQGYSSWVVKDNRAYTQYQTLGGQFVICVDASDGRTLWRYRYDWPYETAGLYPGPRSTPTIANGRLYFSTPSGDVACLSSRGILIWKRDLKTEFSGRGTDFGYSCSPTVVDGMVFMPVGGRGASMVALDADDGSVVWTSGDASASYTPALPITIDDHRQIVGYLEHELAAFDRMTGRQLWRQRLSRGYDEHSAWPIFSDPFLWSSAPFQGGSQLLRLSGGQGATFKRQWQSSTMSNDVSSSVLVDDHVYGFDLAEAQSKAHRPSRGVFRCIDFQTAETAWSNGNANVRRSADFQENKDQQIVGHASVIAADGKLILFNDLGELILARADPDRYIELGRAPVLSGEICWAAPALDRGRIFLRNHARAVCIYVGEPDLMEQIATDETTSVSDLPQDAVADLAAILGVEPEYAMDPPTYRWLKVWYLASIAAIVGAGAIAGVVMLSKRSPSLRFVRTCFAAAAMILGLVVGPLVSIETNDFVFTWPVTLFVAFQIVVYRLTLRRSNARIRDRQSRLRDRIGATAFLGVCLGYFFLCRRLSLVTEWVFLCGFVAALPILLVSRGLADRQQQAVVLVFEFVLGLLAFTAFFGWSVLLLSFKYDLAEF